MIQKLSLYLKRSVLIYLKKNNVLNLVTLDKTTPSKIAILMMMMLLF